MIERKEMEKLMVNVPYLDGFDINQDGSLKNYVSQGAPCVVMVQGNFCGYCTQAKPMFSQFAQMTKRGFTVQTDGNPSEQEAAKFSQIWTPKVGGQGGVPAFIGFNSNGIPVKIHMGNRDIESLVAFLKSL